MNLSNHPNTSDPIKFNDLMDALRSLSESSSFTYAIDLGDRVVEFRFAPGTYIEGIDYPPGALILQGKLYKRLGQMKKVGDNDPMVLTGIPTFCVSAGYARHLFGLCIGQVAKERAARHPWHMEVRREEST